MEGQTSNLTLSLIVTGSFDGACGDPNITLSKGHDVGRGDYQTIQYTYSTYVPWTDGLQCTLVSNVPSEEYDKLENLKKILEAGEKDPAWKTINEDILCNLKALKAKGKARRFHIVVHGRQSFFKS